METCCEAVNVVDEFAIGPSPARPGVDQRILVGPAVRGALERFADGVGQERGVVLAPRVRKSWIAESTCHAMIVYTLTRSSTAFGAISVCATV